jgi:SAM-dependent methyltransferase
MLPGDAGADRRRRESEFHDRIASDLDPAATLVDETFTARTAAENQHILQQFGDVRGKRVLDYGCGLAEGGIYLAKLGAKVVGMDVSERMLASAQQLAGHHGVALETRLVTTPQIPADDGEFDLIYGNGVLHHVDLDTAIPELARVLRPEGRGCFLEPLPYNPLINVYRKMADKVRTVDETPLRFEDIERFRSHFSELSHREFWLLTLSVFLKFFLVDRVHPNQERYWKKIYTDAALVAPLYAPLERVDRWLLDRVPPLRRLCWVTVITVGGPRRAPLPSGNGGR